MNKRECLDAAESAREKRVVDHRFTEARRIAELYKKYPRLGEIDAALRENIANFTQFAFGGSRNEDKFNEFKEKSLNLQGERARLLVDAGLDKDVWMTRPYCEKCDDKGYTETGRCDCLKRELSVQILKNSNLSASYSKMTLDKFDLSYYSSPSDRAKMELVLDYVKCYVRDFAKKNGNLLFMGRSGSGKTFLSCAVAIALAEKGFFVFYISAQDMISAFEAVRFSHQGDTDRFFNADLLIIDDLGSEFHTQFSETVLYNVINSRINSGKPMLISTNYTPSELPGEYHERLVSRLLNEFLTPMFADVDVRELKKLGK